MNEKRLYKRYLWKNLPADLHWKFSHKKRNVTSFLGKKGITIDYSNDILEKKIQSKEPFCAVRFGGTELSCFNDYEQIRLGMKDTFSEETRTKMKSNSGFYPTDDAHLKEYAEKSLKAFGGADVLGIAGIHMEDYFAKKYAPNAEAIQYRAMEPLGGRWSHLLAGKKVLVVSPFGREINAQYANREKLFLDDPSILPEFTLITLDSPLTLGDIEPTLPTFFDGFEEMTFAVNKLDFDIALVGCGAYGSLLCLYIKSIGKQAIQSGGGTMTLFGIMGKRWENREYVTKHVNPNWIRPYSKPMGYEKVQEGCYW